MNAFIGNHIQFIIEWGQWITAAVAAVSLLSIYRLGRGNRRHLPKGLLGWTAALVLTLLAAVSSLVFARITVIKPGALPILARLEALQSSPAPSLEYRLVDSEKLERVQDLQGRVVLVNFWATWCAPCRHEMPDLDRLQRAHSTEDLVVLTLSDEPREQLLAHDEEKRFAMRSGYLETFPWVDMGSERPVSFLLDRQGVIRDVLTGPWDYDHFARRIDPYL